MLSFSPRLFVRFVRQRRPAVPGHPALRVGRQLFGVLLEPGQILEGIDVVQLQLNQRKGYSSARNVMPARMPTARMSG